MKKIALLITLALIFQALYAQSAQTSLDNGKRLFDQGSYDEAIEEFSEAIRLDPNNNEARNNLSAARQVKSQSAVKDGV